MERMPDGRLVRRLYSFQDFVLSYFHPDWEADSSSFTAAVDDAKAALSPAQAGAVAKDVTELVGRGLDEPLLSDYVLARYSLNFDPRTTGLPMAVFLADLADRLRRPRLDKQLAGLGNSIRLYVNAPSERSKDRASGIEGFLLQELPDDWLNASLGIALALYSPAGGEGIVDDAGMESAFRLALESISARVAGIGIEYWSLINDWLTAAITCAELRDRYWPMRRAFMDAGQWFEGALGTDVASFDTDVDALLSDASGEINEEEFRPRATAVRDHIIRVLTP
jgi:contact-dependent growth inhibition (CDI) system CdiI-like immunity protein